MSGERCLWCDRPLRQVYDTKTERVPVERPKCRWCGHKGIPDTTAGYAVCDKCKSPIVTTRDRVVERKPRWPLKGPYGDGFFDTLQCGRLFGASAARAGYRIKRGKP